MLNPCANIRADGTEVVEHEFRRFSLSSTTFTTNYDRLVCEIVAQIAERRFSQVVDVRFIFAGRGSLVTRMIQLDNVLYEQREYS